MRLGEHNLRKRDSPEQLRTVSRIIPHPRYEARNHRHDLMLLRLTRPVRVTAEVRPVPLPARCPQAGEACVVSGWGLVADKEPGATGSPESQGACVKGWNLSGLPRGPYSPGLSGGGDKGLKFYRFAPTLLSSAVRLPDTLHCANIGIISTASCNKDYAGHLMDTMVCAGVEGGGIDSCEVRGDRRPRKEGKRRGNRFGSWNRGPGFACCGPGKMLRIVLRKGE